MGFFATYLYSQLFVTPPMPTADWSGKTAIVTGSNTGLGKETARHLVRLGASKVIIAVRDLVKGEAARDDIVQSQRCRPEIVHVWELDLGDFDSVKRFAKRCEDELERIDALVENAGVGSFTNWKMMGEYETMLKVNVVSTFLLALLLLPKMRQTARLFGIQPRLVIVSSEAHYNAPFLEANTARQTGRKIFDVLNDKESSVLGHRYFNTKLIEVLIVRKWSEEYMNASDYPIILNAVAPGMCHSELVRDAPLITGLIVKIMYALLARKTEVGSRQFVDAASRGKESHGQFLWDCQIKLPSAQAQDEELQTKVWLELKDILEVIQPGVTSNL
jgi:retinol dehydrogenase 12